MSKPQRTGWEFYYHDKNGAKSDRDVHAVILGAVDKVERPIDETIMAPIRKRHRAR